MSMIDASQNFFDDRARLSFIRRAENNFSQHDFLYRWAADEINERLSDITREFRSVLLAGRHPSIPARLNGGSANITRLPQSSPEILLDHVGQYDLILSMGELHHANDLPGLLVQYRKALQPDGVFMAAFAGGETLKELRASLLEGEIEVSGGASPRVFPFVDKQQMAGLMQRAGFTLPVVDSEKMIISYRDIFHLMKDLRGMGEANSLSTRQKNFTSSRVFFEAAKIYHNRYQDQDGRIGASMEVIFVIGWAPHESQQKPAKRGSGQVSLSEIL